MAESAAPVTPSDADRLLKEMNRLVEIGLQDRAKHESRITDCYALAMPWRHKFNETRANVDLDQVYDETLGTVVEDFSADMLNTFTPRKNNWLKEEPAKTVPPDIRARAKKALDERQEFIFAEMARSNLYQALQEAYMDLGPGTMALVITDPHNPGPVHCECLPAPDLIIVKGPYGYVSGQFRKRERSWEDIEVLWPGADMDQVGPPPQDKSAGYEVIDGCWRDWSDKGNEAYEYAVQVAGKLVYHKTWKGAGSCPFIVARWARDPTTAWGVGPTYRTLPAAKTLNHYAYLSLKNFDKHVDPVVSYEDDGVMNIDNGVNPGDWVPRAPNSKEPKAIESQARLDYQSFEIDEKRSIIRRAHYQDRPEQLGKTPPTATQWADEAAERARRMGTPATNLVVELQIPIYLRFLWLFEQRGTLPKVEVDGQSVSIEPVSPLLRAQQQEAVVRRDKWLELLTARYGPQMAAVLSEPFRYAQKQAESLGVEPELARDEKTVGDAIKQLLPVLQGSTGGQPGEVAPPALGTIAPGVAA